MVVYVLLDTSNPNDLFFFSSSCLATDSLNTISLLLFLFCFVPEHIKPYFLFCFNIINHVFPTYNNVNILTLIKEIKHTKKKKSNHKLKSNK